MSGVRREAQEGNRGDFSKGRLVLNGNLCSRTAAGPRLLEAAGLEVEIKPQRAA